MAARRGRPPKKKTVKKRVTVTKKNSKTNNWWDQYSFTTWEFTRRFVLFLLLTYVALTYRGFIIAATVNGEPISRFSVISDLEAQSGTDVLETLINETLIRQKANETHVKVTQADIDEKIAEIETNFVSEGQTLDDLLALQGMTRVQFESQLKTQVMVEKLLEGDVTVSDEEVVSFLEENKDFLPTDLSQEELSEVAKDQLKQQKLSIRFSTWIQEIRGEANITKFVSY